MRLATSIACLFAASLTWADETARLINGDWPERGDCAYCIELQLGRLVTKIPSHWIERVTAVRFDQPHLRVQLRNQAHEVQSDLIFYELPTSEVTGAFKKAGFFDELGIQSTAEFFQVLGDRNKSGRAVDTMRQIMRVSTASHYRKLSKGELTVYWIDTEAEDSIYISPDGRDVLYQIYGPAIDETLLHTLLVNLEHE